MLNQTVIVGRLVEDPEVKELENGKKVANITLAVPRSYRNEDGDYDTDFLNCTLWSEIAENTAEYCKKGDLLGVKGRIQSRVIEDGENKNTVMEIVAEKVTFLSSKVKNDDIKKTEDVESDIRI